MRLKANIRWMQTNHGWFVSLDDLLSTLENMKEADIPVGDLLNELKRLKESDDDD